MRIVGEWRVGDGDVTRPVVELEVQAAAGRMEHELFLVDPGADRTVFSASLLARLGVPTVPAPTGLALEGIGGRPEFSMVETIVRVPDDDGGGARFRGEFAAFTDLAASEISILGREILNHFDVILSHRRNEVLLLTKEHTYRVVTT